MMIESRLNELKTAQGFSLVELMISMVLSLFLIGGVVLVYSSGRASIINAEELSRAQENLRFVSEFLIRDLRMAGFDSPSSYINEGGSASELEVSYVSPTDCLGRSTAAPADWDDSTDGVFPDSGKTFNRYYLDGNSLNCENKLGESQKLVDGIRNITFNVIDGASGDATALNVTLELQNPPVENAAYSFNVAFRNRVLYEVFEEKINPQ